VKVEKHISVSLSESLSQDTTLADELNSYVSEYNNILKRLNFYNEVFENKFSKENVIIDAIRFLFFLPFVSAGALFNAIPALISSFLSKKTDDPQFISSIKFGIGNVVFPIYYLLFLVLPIPFITKILLIIIMPVLGILSYDYFKGLRIFWASVRLRIGLSQNDPAISRLIYARSQIIKRVRKCMGEELES